MCLAFTVTHHGGIEPHSSLTYIAIVPPISTHGAKSGTNLSRYNQGLVTTINWQWRHSSRWSAATLIPSRCRRIIAPIAHAQVWADCARLITTVYTRISPTRVSGLRHGNTPGGDLVRRGRSTRGCPTHHSFTLVTPCCS